MKLFRLQEVHPMTCAIITAALVACKGIGSSVVFEDALLETCYTACEVCSTANEKCWGV